jgi:hypothetical protein
MRSLIELTLPPEGKRGLKNEIGTLNGLCKRALPCYGRINSLSRAREAIEMDEQESILTHPGSQEMAVHVRDYSKFIKLFKWGAAVCFVIGMLWLMIVKAYW